MSSEVKLLEQELELFFPEATVTLTLKQFHEIKQKIIQNTVTIEKWEMLVKEQETLRKKYNGLINDFNALQDRYTAVALSDIWY